MRRKKEEGGRRGARGAAWGDFCFKIAKINVFYIIFAILPAKSLGF